MSDEFNNGQDDVILLVKVVGDVPLPALHLHVVPRHLRGVRTGATVFLVSAGTRTNVGTATVWQDFSFLRLAEIRAVGARDEDGGAGGSGQQGDSTVVRGLLTHTCIK